MDIVIGDKSIPFIITLSIPHLCNIIHIQTKKHEFTTKNARIFAEYSIHRFSGTVSITNVAQTICRPLTTANLESVNIQFQKQILSYCQKLKYEHEFYVLCLVVNQIYFIITSVDIADLDFLTWISVSRITFFIFLFYLYKIVPNQLTFQISAQINSGQVSMLFKNDSLHYFLTNKQHPTINTVTLLTTKKYTI
eukprot:TRINITY_DN3623_c0_g1_i10.p1 TRINITY_DN3623_c0_g1~~TRINITY_DN3623_c0_g1_i10.p1  ORF type:complete len:194 (+),score=-15.46 TRINITY_DN3623_c0_g1_i10:455-1036(+)